MSSITITLRLFGAFRKYGERIEFPVTTGSSVAAIKEAIRKELATEIKDLVSDSVIANDETILPGSYIIDSDASLSILPPVCGG
jgi:molybdopterin converting factor small subunit